MRIATDILIIGSGAAGLFLALKAAEAGQVLLITKGEPADSNTSWAQGGIAGVFDEADGFEAHIRDTLTAGAGLCHEEIVRQTVEEGPARIRELMAFGTNFDHAPGGKLQLGREGGHSANRILHHGDATGREISRALQTAAEAHPNIRLLDHLFAVDLLTQHHLGRYVNKGHPDITCFGCYALDLGTREMHTLLARATVLASGGAGHVYASTTNPLVASGDGIGMAYRAKARVANMEFVQFHPTAFYDPEAQPAFLITEALRGKGAVLRNSYSGERFVHKHDERGELAPRDIVARAIDAELKHSGTAFVHLDATRLPADELRAEFPTITRHCAERGIDITREPIPVRPAAHYLCGGVQTDAHGRSSIHRLYALGECACTGLHGANRLASNSLLEAIVFASHAARDLAARLPGLPLREDLPDWQARGAANAEEWVIVSHNRRELQRLMSEYVGIVRSNLRLERAARRIELIHHETEDFYRRTRVSPEVCELRNLITCAYLTVKSAHLRRESRGLHFTTDYPRLASAAFDTVV